MDIKELKSIIRNEKGKVIIMENEEPVMVIMSFSDYKGMLNGTEEVAEPKERIQEKEVEAPTRPSYEPERSERSDDNISLDDLPV